MWLSRLRPSMRAHVARNVSWATWSVLVQCKRAVRPRIWERREETAGWRTLHDLPAQIRPVCGRYRQESLQLRNHRLCAAVPYDIEAREGGHWLGANALRITPQGDSVQQRGFLRAPGNDLVVQLRRPIPKGLSATRACGPRGCGYELGQSTRSKARAPSGFAQCLREHSSSSSATHPRRKALREQAIRLRSVQSAAGG